MNKSNVMKKIFEQIEREKNENEYNRTEIQERANYLTDQLLKFKFDLNQSGALRIIESLEKSSHNKSYSAEIERENKKALKKALNGLECQDKLVYL